MQSAVAAPTIAPGLEKSLASAAGVAAIADGPSLAQAAWNEANSLSRLSKLWGLKEEAVKGDCSDLASAGLYCYRLQTGLGQARELDRPFLLKLKAAAGADKWVLVREMDALQARLETANGPAMIRLPQLEAASDSEVLTLWRMDPGFRVQLLKGMRGPDVDWLARQLAAWADPASNARPQDSIMDAALIQRVRQFQQVQGLGADGVVGPRTWMKLNAVAGLSEPRLQASLNLASR
jgi:general secretion pathway protein A